MSIFTLRTSACAAIVFGALLAGCGGGPQGYTPPSTVVTSSPTTPATSTTTAPATATTTAPATATTTAPATATTTAPATATTTAPATVTTNPPGVANDHPSNGGTQYTYTGSSTTTYTRPQQYPSPEPTQTTTVAITQAVTVTNPVTFSGNAAAIDYHTVEQDAQVAPAPQSYTTTYDNYYAYTGTAFAGNFQLLGYNMSDSYGNTLGVTYGTSGVLTDMLPEASGQTWTNVPTATLIANEPNDESSIQTINADGTYSTSITYPAVNAGGSNRTIATVVANLDGSGLYTTPRLGTVQDTNYTYAISAPSGGNISETTTIPPDAGTTSTPDAVTTSFASWIPTGFVGAALANETDTDMGSVTMPTACNAEPGLGTTANEVVQTKNRVDPMLGQLEVTTTTNYVVPNFGPACVVVDDVLTYYYDFTGQNGTGYFSATPQQVSELQETLSLSGQSIQNAARSGGGRFSESRAFGQRVQLAQAQVVSNRALEREHFLRSNALGRHFNAAALRSRTI